MSTCAVCGTELPAQVGPRPRRYCSRACQAKAYRARQEQRTTRRAVAADEQRLVSEYEGVSSRELASSLSLAAGRIAGALAAGSPADEFDLGVLARIPVVLTARAQQAALRSAPMPAPPEFTPTVTVLDLEAPPAEGASRGDALPAPPRRAQTTKASRDVLPTWDTTAIQPRPQRMSKKRAQAVIDTAELVRAPDYSENPSWVLRNGDTLIGYVVPSYGGTSRSGRNGWIGSLSGMNGPRCRTRDEAMADLADRWLRIVTSAPR